MPQKTKTLLHSLLLTLSISLIPLNSLAADSCEVTLGLCRSAIAEQEKSISLRDYGIQIRQDEVVRLQLENTKLREADTSLFKNPFIWAAVGVILGAYAGARVTR